MLFSSSSEPLTTLCGEKSNRGLGETSADRLAVTELLSLSRGFLHHSCSSPPSRSVCSFGLISLLPVTLAAMRSIYFYRWIRVTGDREKFPFFFFFLEKTWFGPEKRLNAPLCESQDIVQTHTVVTTWR